MHGLMRMELYNKKYGLMRIVRYREEKRRWGTVTSGWERARPVHDGDRLRSTAWRLRGAVVFAAVIREREKCGEGEGDIGSMIKWRRGEAASYCREGRIRRRWATGAATGCSCTFSLFWLLLLSVSLLYSAIPFFFKLATASASASLFFLL